MIVDRFCLNKHPSVQETWHIIIDIRNDRFPFRPGDSIGIWPKNTASSVQEMLSYFHLSPSSTILDPKKGSSHSIGQWLTQVVDLNRVSEKLITSLMQCASSHDDRHSLDQARASGETFEQYDVPSLLNRFVPHGVSLTDIAGAFLPIIPRLYSISSGPSVHGSRVELTVARVVRRFDTVVRHGLCSHFLIEEAPLHVPCLSLFHQPTKHFVFPTAAERPLVMVGAGTGIAPFRAFMQEVECGAVAEPKCWLFFGEKRSQADFFYEEFWNSHVAAGRLRLDLAFSRDQEQKLYVQHRMWENRRELWEWIDNGATIMVCGNAKSMAKDVDSCLAQIASTQGGLSEEESLRFLRQLHSHGRYLRDVYGPN
jgi:sulfite reductase (NADPH) flavoprotein alpha-component